MTTPNSGPENEGHSSPLTGSAISRYAAEKRAQTRRALEENPAVLPETIARHYTSLATTAMQLRECIAARQAGATGMEEAIAHYVARLRQCYINDFGAEPHWPNDTAERLT